MIEPMKLAKLDGRVTYSISAERQAVLDQAEDVLIEMRDEFARLVSEAGVVEQAAREMEVLGNVVKVFSAYMSGEGTSE